MRTDDSVNEEGIDGHGRIEEGRNKGFEERGGGGGRGREEPGEDERIGVQAGLEEEGEGLVKSGWRGGALQEAETVLLSRAPWSRRAVRGRRGAEPAAERMRLKRSHLVGRRQAQGARDAAFCNVHLQVVI